MSGYCATEFNSLPDIDSGLYSLNIKNGKHKIMADEILLPIQVYFSKSKHITHIV